MELRAVRHLTLLMVSALTLHLVPPAPAQGKTAQGKAAQGEAAQEKAAPGKPAPQATAPDPVVLTIRGGPEGLPAQLTQSFGMALPEAPQLRQDQRLELRVRLQQGMTLHAVPAGEDFVVRLRPEAIPELLARKNGILGNLLEGLSQSFLTARGLEPRYTAHLIARLRKFPRQWDEFHLSARRRTGIDGWRIDLSLRPKAGSWIGGILAGIQSSPRGGFVLRDPKAPLSVSCGATGPGLQGLLEAWAEHLAQVRGRKRAERASFAAAARQRLAQVDGSFGLLITAPGEYLRIVGLKDPKAFARLSAEPALARFDRRRMGGTELLLDDAPAPLQAQGIRRLATSEQVFGDPDPLRDATSTFVGVVGDASIQFRLPSDGAACSKHVARLAAQRLRRFPLPDKALFQALLQLPDRDRILAPLQERLGTELETLQFLLGDATEILKQIPREVRVQGWRRGDAKAPRLDLQILTRD